MPPKKKAILSIICVALVLISGLLYGGYYQAPKPAPKPLPSQPEEINDPEWYVQFTVKGQKVTAYTGSSAGTKASSGDACYLGSVAVHPIYPGIDPRKPIIPYGTEIILNEPIVVQGNSFSSFTVIDTGDIYYGRYGETPYWFDVYYGNANYQNIKASREFGIDTRDYTWIEKWR